MNNNSSSHIVNKMISYILIFIIAVSCNSHTRGKNPAFGNDIDKKISEAMAKNNVPSLSIGVIRDGKIDVLKGFGTRSRIDTSSVNERSIFQIASQSKMLTGIIVNNLLLEGKLDLEESIAAYFSSDIEESTKQRLGAIKLKYLLNHTSGIPNDACSVYSQRIDGDAWTSGYSKVQLIADINNLDLEFEPNSKFQYANSGYAILGFICETVSGLTYHQLLQKYIVEEYGLKHTSVKIASSKKPLLVTPYRKDDRMVETEPSNMGMATPASAIYSNAVDLTKILSQQLIAYRKNEMQNPLILTKHTSKMDQSLQYGFGLIKEVKGDNTKYGHGGDADGFACEYFLNPKKNAGVVVLTSSGGRWIGELTEDILASL